VFDDPTLFAAYRRETEHLNAERLPLVVVLCLGLIGVSGSEAPAELTALGGICLVTGTSLLMAWGVRGQLAVVTASLAAFITVLALTRPTQVPEPHLLFAVTAAGAISLFGAYYLDLHRFAIFCEATRREEETAVSQSLVAIAKEINDSLDADDVLDRIAGVTRSALHASWSVIVLRDPLRESFLIVGCAGRTPEAIGSLRGVEFACGAFPLVDRVLAERDLTLLDDSADPAIAELMQRWETRSLLGATLQRRDAVVGILLAGTRGREARFSERGRELFRGIAQHVAIALNNVRLVGDLRRANELKSDFLSTMSHELRTPLNVIIGYTDLLRDEAFGSLVPEQQDVLGRVRTNAHSLLELINATLEVNRIEAGRSSVQLREIDLRQLMSELQLEAKQLPRQSGVALRWELPRTSDLVRTDPMKLKIVVRNLIGNALKFTRRGAVVVQVGFDQRGKLLDIAVRDTGAGIDPEHLPQIFDMFHQAPSDACLGGVGLGLYIVKRFVELLGGRVSATSSLGEGSVFRVSLPAGIVAQPLSLEEHRLRRSA